MGRSSNTFDYSPFNSPGQICSLISCYPYFLTFVPPGCGLPSQARNGSALRGSRCGKATGTLLDSLLHPGGLPQNPTNSNKRIPSSVLARNTMIAHIAICLTSTVFMAVGLSPDSHHLLWQRTLPYL